MSACLSNAQNSQRREVCSEGIWICNLSLSNAFSNLSTRHRQETKPLHLRTSGILRGLVGALFSRFETDLFRWNQQHFPFYFFLLLTSLQDFVVLKFETPCPYENTILQ